MARVAPLLARRDDDDLGRDQGPEPARPERDDALAPGKPATRRPLLDRQGDELDRPTQVEVARRGLVLASLAILGPALGRERLDAEPFSVRGEEEAVVGLGRTTSAAATKCSEPRSRKVTIATLDAMASACRARTVLRPYLEAIAWR